MTDRSYVLKLITTTSKNAHEMQAEVATAIGRHAGKVTTSVSRFAEGSIEIELQGPRAPIDAAHFQLSKDFAQEQPFMRVLDELGDELRGEAYLLLGQLEQQLRRFINEAMIAAGMGIDWWNQVADDRLVARNQTTRQKSQSAIYHHPVEFTELDQLLELVTVDLPAWSLDKVVTVEDLLQLLAHQTDLDAIRETVVKRTEKRSFWDAVFSSYFDDLNAWRDWKSRWKDVIGLRNRVMHHRPVFANEIERLHVTSSAFTEFLQAGRKRLSEQERMKMRLAALQLVSTFRSRGHLHEEVGGDRMTGISVAVEAGAIFLFSRSKPRLGGWPTEADVGASTIYYEGEPLRGISDLRGGNRAIRDHVADGRELHMFTYGAPGEIEYSGRAVYERHFFSDSNDGTSKVMFELELYPAPSTER